MNNDHHPHHPITPPPELVEQWRPEGVEEDSGPVAGHIATQAAQPEPQLPADDDLLSLDDLRDAWDSQADAVNDWDELGIDEIVWWAQRQALARWGTAQPPADGEATEQPPLSPAAQAVLTALFGSTPTPGRHELAAALRAAVAATQQRQYGGCWICGAADLLAIAAELDGGAQ